jgi:hypothetical protein
VGAGSVGLGSFGNARATDDKRKVGVLNVGEGLAGTGSVSAGMVAVVTGEDDYELLITRAMPCERIGTGPLTVGVVELAAVLKSLDDVLDNLVDSLQRLDTLAVQQVELLNGGLVEPGVVLHPDTLALLELVGRVEVGVARSGKIGEHVVVTSQRGRRGGEVALGVGSVGHDCQEEGVLGIEQRLETSQGLDAYDISGVEVLVLNRSLAVGGHDDIVEVIDVRLELLPMSADASKFVERVLDLPRSRSGPIP